MADGAKCPLEAVHGSRSVLDFKVPNTVILRCTKETMCLDACCSFYNIEGG